MRRLVPSHALDGLTKGALRDMKQNLPLAEDGAKLWILRIGRYNNAKDSLSDLFDLSVIDGDKETSSVSLHPDMSALVRNGVISENTVVCVRGYKLVFDELFLGGNGFVEISSLENVEFKRGKGSVDVDVSLHFERPLRGKRAFYLAPLDDTCVVSSNWQAEDISFETTCLKDISINEYTPSIAEIMELTAEQSRKRKRNHKVPPLVGRVVAIGSLNYFGKPSDENPYPINFQLVIGDASKYLSVSVWNSACHLYYNALDIGDIVVVDNYRIKATPYANAIHYSHESNSLDLQVRNLEVAVNAQNPEGHIFKITGDYAGPELPSVSRIIECSWLSK
jgi:hypothetical protein